MRANACEAPDWGLTRTAPITLMSSVVRNLSMSLSSSALPLVRLTPAFCCQLLPV